MQLTLFIETVKVTFYSSCIGNLLMYVGLVSNIGLHFLDPQYFCNTELKKDIFEILFIEMLS